jgi:hypothetical protein
MKMIPDFSLAVTCAATAIAVMVLPAFSASQSGDLPQSREWVIKDVLLPNPVIPGEDVNYGTPRFLGDTDGDGLIEALFGWNSFPVNGGISWHYQVLNGKTFNRDGRAINYLINNWFYNQTVGLNSPIGSLLTSPVPLSLDTGVYSVSSGKLKTLLPVPPPAYSFEVVMRAGDLNQDGWDDLFVYPSDGSPGVNVGMIVGKTNTVAWNDHDTSVMAWSAYPVWSYDAAGPPDLDGDGIAEFLISYPLLRTSGNPPYPMLYRAYSGLSGILLWEKILYQQESAGFFSNQGSDLNGDGVNDLTVAESNIYDFANGIISDGRLSALSGTNGDTIWEVPTKFIDPKWATGISIEDYYFPRHPVFPTPDMNGDGVDEVSFAVHNFVRIDPKVRRVIATFSGTDGAFLGLERMPNTAIPWLDEPVDYGADSRRLTPLGDFDNDGWPEMALQVDAPSFDQNGGTVPPTALAILSHPSLIADAEAGLGEEISFEIHVPNAPAKNYRILASTQFSPRGGLFVDGWNTHLGASSVLNYFITHQPFGGSLNNQGKANGSIPIPMIPGLSGKTLYFKAAITDPNKPGQVQALTNLRWTKIH